MPPARRRNAALAHLACAMFAVSAAAAAQPIVVVAAESVYGAICRDIGGDRVAVTSILASPSQDPHAFEANASTARAVAQARVVVYNGGGYDAWMSKLLAASKPVSRATIDVASLAGRNAADNPHVWYDVSTVSTFGRTLAQTLSELDPDRRAFYSERLAAFDASMRPLAERIASMRQRYAGTPVTATEPVFGYMADAVGLAMRNQRFQLATMNGTEPAAKDIAAFEHDLRARSVRVLIVNRQSGGPLVDRIRSLAQSSGVPVVAVGETLPPGMTYPQWMLSELDALDRALATPPK